MRHWIAIPLKATVVAGLLILASCASIEGTRDKSHTSYRAGLGASIESLAILPVPNTAASPGLSAQLGDALTGALREHFSQAKVVSPAEFTTMLAATNDVERFGQWKAAYEQTSILAPRPVADFARCVGVRYLLMVRSIYLDREKIRAVDAGYSGWVSDAKNVWRARLRFTVEVLDANVGKVVWSGTGEAENVTGCSNT
jgi:hypothetical protein